jgi:hypothetical protein
MRKETKNMKRSTLALCLILVTSLATPGVLGAASGSRIPNDVVILDYNGISPAAFTHAQGEFVLLIVNRLPNKSETFTLVSPSPSTGAPAPGVQPASTDSYHDCASLDLTLPPGTYHLQLKNHPNLSVIITITP